METILVLAHTETDGSLAKPAREALHAAATLHKSLAGSQARRRPDRRNRPGGGQFHRGLSRHEIFRRHRRGFRPVALRHRCGGGGSLCQAAQATIIVAPATSRWNRVLPGVAQRSADARTRTSPASADAGKLSVNRWYYRQRMEAVSTRTQRPWFILIDPGSQTPCECGAGTAAVETVAVNLPDACKRTTVVGVREPKADAQTIRPDAQLCCSSPARAGPRNRPTARRMFPKRKN
jgi:electron transfer flavoprotein alpha subunit